MMKVTGIIIRVWKIRDLSLSALIAFQVMNYIRWCSTDLPDAAGLPDKQESVHFLAIRIGGKNR